ncbi:MAG TPA: hypothetical protein VMK12_21150 [Anaeromyxobacteraceae bacterium]|nr:hypothetical protein [Anaeromyxobacteraceae bacterium]
MPVGVKVNAQDILREQLGRGRRGNVLPGTVTGPDQPAEKWLCVNRATDEEAHTSPRSVMMSGLASRAASA